MKRSNFPVEPAASNNDDVNIIVLPPNLLKELGINLGNIAYQTDQLTNQTENSIVGHASKKNTQHFNDSGDESSILKTANLMKESVLLSPSFVSTCNESPNKVNLSDTFVEDASITDGNELLLNDVENETDIAVKRVFGFHSSSIAIQQEHKVTKDAAYDDHINNCSEPFHSYGDKGLEYEELSDNSNVSSKNILRINKTVEEGSKERNYHNKIEIISEKTTNNKNLNIVKKQKIKQSNCFVVPVNTIVKGKTTINNYFCNNSAQKKDRDRTSTETKNNMKAGDDIGQAFPGNHLNTDKVSHEGEGHNLKDVMNSSTTIKVCPETTNPTTRVEANDHRLHHSLQSHNNNFERVQNTDEMVFNEDDTTVKNSIEHKRDILNIMDEKTAEIFSKTKNKTNPKLCIQGVEKPGGDFDIKASTGLKTYKKTHSNKRSPEIIQIDFSKIVDSSQLTEETEKIMNDMSVTEYQSCICKDFGQLVNYDTDNDKHVHFCNSNDVRCNLETLFSIYDDATVPRKLQITENVDDVVEGETCEKIQNNICWLSVSRIDENSAEVEENSDEEIDKEAIDESMLSEGSNSTVDQIIRRSTRKRKSIADRCDPKVNKSTKCGVCSQIVLEADWNKHINSAHNMIAWKDGDTIVEESSLENTDKKSPKMTSSTRRSSRLEVPVSVQNESLSKSGQSTDNTTMKEKPGGSNAKLEKSSAKKQKFSNMKAVTSVAQKDLQIATKSNRKFSVENSQINDSDVKYSTSSKKTVDISSSKSTRSSIKKSVETTDALQKSTKNDPLKYAAITANLNRKFVDVDVEMGSKIQKSLSGAIPQKVTSKIKDITENTKVSCGMKKANKILSSKLNDQPKKFIEINIFEQSASANPKDSNRMNEDSRHSKGKNSSKLPKTTINLGIISSKPKSSSNDNATPLQTKESNAVHDVLSPPLDSSSKSKSKKSDTPPSKVTRSSKSAPASHIKLANTNVEAEKTVSDSYASHAIDVSEERIHSDNDKSSTVQNSAADASQENLEYYVISIKEEVALKCDVCKQDVEESRWIEHICKEHDYLAWRQGDTPLDLEDEVAIHDHLHSIAKAHGVLTCSKCGLQRKYARSYLKHFRSCDNNELTQNQDVSTDIDISQNHVEDNSLVDEYSQNALIRNRLCTQLMIICGVCNVEVKEKDWIEHIRIEHKYLAWKSHENPLNFEDEVELKIHLQTISKYNGGLICHKCGAVRSYVKKYLDHVKSCKGEMIHAPINSTLNNSNISGVSVDLELLPDIVKCGKCGLEVRGSSWMEHNQGHKYLSWIDGQDPIDENDKEALHKHLLSMIANYGELICAKCGHTRKAPRAYLEHVNACEESGYDRRALFVPRSSHVQPDQYECARCLEVGFIKKWRDHAMKNHYNITWMTGEQPLNIRNIYAVEKLLKEYHKKHGKLVCKECGASRVSAYGFYAHILTCGKSPVETAALHEICNICSKSYLCIYRNQHRAMHREQEYKNKQKELKVIKEEEERMREKVEVTGKRRAAEKAREDLEKYTSIIQADGSHQCQYCHQSYDNETLLKDHTCSKDGNASDSDVSIKIEEESDDDEIEIDSNISDEEDDLTRKRKRHSEPTPKITLPFKIKNSTRYLADSYQDFRDLHYTSERLFDNWRNEQIEIMSSEAASKYMPILTESCKIRSNEDEWMTMNRFEVHKRKDIITLFTGGSIHCMQWVPNNITDENDDQYLALSCFAEADSPRFEVDELWNHPGIVQLWNIGKFTSLPKLEMCLVHDYGTIWAMDWCPSGARDHIQEKNGTIGRLGLLAVACSNGGAYIFAVPRISMEEDEPPRTCKLKPIAELRFSSMPARKRYQVTSISWGPQKGHNIIMVGYCDGTTALYDLSLETPWCKATENGVDIFYPFEDKRTENSTITGVALSASHDPRHAFGSASSSSVTGASMRSWSSDVPSVRSHLSSNSLLLSPHWPAVLLCSDDALTMKSTNEMSWWGGGRRLGGACAGAVCVRCSRLCLTAPPFVRLLRVHPVFPDLKKQIVATVKMVPLAQKRKLKQDELVTCLEPVTYGETVKKYGLEFKTIPKRDQHVASKLADTVEQCPERFPLSDMPAAAFCPATDHHNRLALASYAGFVFIVPV